MKTKKIIIIAGIFLVVAFSIFLISINQASITGNVIKNDFEKVKEKDCFILDDGRKICKLGTVTVSAGNILESDYEIKDKNKTKQKKEKD